MSHSDSSRLRTARLVREAVSDFGLAYHDLRVYTEAATGPFAVTAPLAALAGADRVYAVADDSPHGSVADAHDATRALAAELGVEDRITFRSDRRSADVAAADVVTNTGFVRPIDAELVSWMKPTAVVPLMYEPWEFRGEDIDIEACWAAGIPVVGTDESDERVQTQEYLGAVAAKLAFEADIEVFRCRFVVVGGGRMAASVTETLEAMGATVTHVATDPAVEALADRRDASSLADDAARSALADADGLVFIEHRLRTELLGPDGSLSVAELADSNPSVAVLHICGAVDAASLRQSSIRCHPSSPAPAGRMSVTTGYLGPRPIVELNSAGLRVGQLLARQRRAGADVRTAIEAATSDPVVMDFSDKFKRERGYEGSFDG